MRRVAEIRALLDGVDMRYKDIEKLLNIKIRKDRKSVV